MESAAIKKFIAEWIGKNKDEFEELGRKIFETPELGMQEHVSAKLLADAAARHGFAVEMGVADMPTAFVATYGSGRPVVGFSLEYDCLPGLSQKVATAKEPVMEGAPGHGCGHNLLGAGALAAGAALRHAMEHFGFSCTIKLFGTPAEEICIGKPFMARAGLFAGVDAFLDWHPFCEKTFVPKGTNAYFNKYYHFHGKTAHGNSPWNGRSTLDAAMLMGHAVEMLREHIVPGTAAAANTINYTFSNVGPEFPSVVPDRTTVWYVGRFTTTEVMADAMRRIDDCARGAALATGTTVESELVTAIHENLPNMVLGKVVDDNYRAVGPMPVSEEEQEFARQLQRNAGNEPTGIVQTHLPPCEFDAAVTDVSEYSWWAPLASLFAATHPGPNFHHWTTTAASGSAAGMRSISYAARILACSAVDLIASPELVEEAQKEHMRQLRGRTYQSLIPDAIKPPVDANRQTMEKYHPTDRQKSKL